MNDQETQALWAIRNKIKELCQKSIKNLARQNYESAVSNIIEIENIIEAFYHGC